MLVGTTMAVEKGRLGDFLSEMINLRWDDFCKIENDLDYKGYQGTILSLIRICSEGKLGAIKTAIARVDGTVETPIRVEYPKVFILFPLAEEIALSPPSAYPMIETLPVEESGLVEIEPEVVEDQSAQLATLSLRETLIKLSEAPRKMVKLILDRKRETELALADNIDLTSLGKSIPLVKSVIAANLLKLAEGGKFEAITEVFDQIDGKLVETIKVLGEDMYLSSYVLEAPYGAKRNEDGVYYIEAPQVSDVWKAKFKKD